MIDIIVRYLHSQSVPFRLDSYGSPEALPNVAHRLAEGVMLVEAHVLVSDGRPLLACVPSGMGVSLPALTTELGALVVAAEGAELPVPLAGAVGPVPPLGGAFGVTTLVDASVTAAQKIAFRAFTPGDIFEIPYDDFARLESPRVCAFATMGELEVHPPAPPP